MSFKNHIKQYKIMLFIALKKAYKLIFHFQFILTSLCLLLKTRLLKVFPHEKHTVTYEGKEN